MLLRIAAFEVRRSLRSASTYVYCAIFFAIAFFWVTVAGGGVKGVNVDFGASAKVAANAPYAFGLLALLTGNFGTVITASFAGRATFQDVEHRTSPFFFTSPISKLDYLGGRWLGALLSALLLYPWIALGALAAAHGPFVDASRIGPDVALGYLAPYATILVPNLVLTTSLFFAMATLLRRMLPVYVASIVLVLGYILALQLTEDLGTRPLAALLDPFGGNAVDRITEYWSIAEKNVRVVPFTGPLLLNRTLWVGVALALLGVTYARFSFTDAAAPTKPREAKDAAPVAARAPAPSPIPTGALDFSTRAELRAMLGLARLQLRETMKSPFFLVVLVASAIFVAVAGAEVDQIRGTKTYPVTYNVVEVTGSAFALFAVVLIAFYAGELVWRERDARLAPIFDALPVPRWVLFGAKLGALMALQVVLVVALMAGGILLQVAKGYHQHELGLYVQTLFGIRLVSFWVLCALAMFVHVLVNDKAVGHTVMIVIFVASVALPLLGLEHHLYRVGTVPEYKYSAMTGFGHFAAPIVAYEAYWGLFAAAVAILANALWVRGAAPSLRVRLALAARTMPRGTRTLLGAVAVGFAVLGAFIAWNTTVRNRFVPRATEESEKAEYETTYKAAWERAPQVRIRATTLKVDVFPETRRATIVGTYALENPTAVDVSRVVVSVPPLARAVKASFGRGERLAVDDARLGFRVYELGAPLRPGEKAELAFELAYVNEGFTDSASDTHVVENGSFLKSESLLGVGYDSSREIVDDAARSKYGLAPRHVAPPGDAFARMRNYGAGDADWIDLDMTIGTSADQLGIAPGTLLREWTENGRRYFHYRPEGKVMPFFSCLSGRYVAARDVWHPPPGAAPGTRDVAIEVDYHPGHAYDVARMIKGVQRSLDYFTRAFGPYPHAQVRIVEFPRFAKFAEADPGLIPFSESIGFLARVDEGDPDDVDYPFYVTAHEVAHMWWGHQVVSADVQGATLLSESLAQYSALMVMKHELGEAQMKKFLRYELDRYLRGRSSAKRSERPLALVEDEPYIHYAKGSLAMYALQDYIGEDAVNAALASVVRDWAFKGPPYPDARTLVAAFRQVTPPEYAYVLDDLFETITLYENRTTHASCTKRGDGKYDVQIDVTAKKLRASELGAETEVPMADFVDIGAVDAAGKIVALTRVKMDRATASYTLVTDAPPAKAGVDPMGKLIDRFPGDNLAAVEQK
jgi:ABC-2 type transport system permease protein